MTFTSALSLLTFLQIAMHAFASHLLSDTTTEATWIDSTGSFLGEALKAIICAKAKRAEEASSAMDRARITRVFDLYGVVETIDEVKTTHGLTRVDDEDYARRKSGVRLVVVDSITQPYVAMVGKSRFKGTVLQRLCG